MRIVGKVGNEDIAMVYIAESKCGKLIEFVESVQPPLPREKKWVLTISTLYGCPVSCRFCDAGGQYKGKLSVDEILFQIDYLIRRRFPNRNVSVKKFKIQFARVGEPAYNKGVISVLGLLPDIYDVPGLMISLSTITPIGCDEFFERLLEIKNKYYYQKFQLQFSIHTTDEKMRRWLIPVRTWSFKRMAEYGEAFYKKGDRKITLNFALAKGMGVDPEVLLKYFDPASFLIKITPVNPTFRAKQNNISSAISPGHKHEIVEVLHNVGYEVILSVGELEENNIGSNCGQYITNYRKKGNASMDSYTYNLQKVAKKEV